MKTDYFSKYFHYLALFFVLLVHFLDRRTYYKGEILNIDDCPSNRCSVSILLDNDKKINMNIRKYKKRQFIPPSVGDSIYISSYNDNYRQSDFITYSINKHFYIMFFITLLYFLYKVFYL